MAAHFWHSEILSPSQTLEQEVCLKDNISILPLWFDTRTNSDKTLLTLRQTEWCSDCGPLCHWHGIEIAAQAVDACSVCKYKRVGSFL